MPSGNRFFKASLCEREPDCRCTQNKGNSIAAEESWETINGVHEAGDSHGEALRRSAAYGRALGCTAGSVSLLSNRVYVIVHFRYLLMCIEY